MHAQLSNNVNRIMLPSTMIINIFLTICQAIIQLKWIASSTSCKIECHFKHIIGNKKICAITLLLKIHCLDLLSSVA